MDVNSSLPTAGHRNRVNADRRRRDASQSTLGENERQTPAQLRKENAALRRRDVLKRSMALWVNDRWAVALVA